MIDLLVEQPANEWKKIICISRRACQLDVNDPRVTFVSIDVLETSVEKIVEELEKVDGRTITDIFHYTYIEKKNEEELDRVNRIILEKALDACVQLAGHTIRSFSLQTGYKVSLVYRSRGS